MEATKTIYCDIDPSTTILTSIATCYHNSIAQHSLNTLIRQYVAQ